MFMSSHTPDQIATVIRRVPGTTDTPDQIKTALDSLAPFNPKTPDVSAQDWVATLAFANGFLSMDTSSPGFAYGTFWNSQFIEQSPYFVP
jgi:hypothetical protein